ncbi:hypothetical protein VCR31J2_1310907 [Vibrio coralliirubri]|uniref:Uncharacterized protein n=1 Tax=Vibrio coralliirubri TaxID=1516159 RepID=A0AA86WUV7_9VIBR|nr:hypothetical protein VCR31J2_1310907 [Vibrio coralliirubri]
MSFGRFSFTLPTSNGYIADLPSDLQRKRFVKREKTIWPPSMSALEATLTANITSQNLSKH